jgi:hypothetical protein
MKRSKADRRVEALARLKASTFENSRASRRVAGVSTKEEWLKQRDAEIHHLEERINGKRTS